MHEKEIRIEARIRNNVLWHAIFDVWPSVAAFCRMFGFYDSQVGALLNLKLSPLQKRNKQYTSLCRRLAKVLGYSCIDLFPLHLYNLEQVVLVSEVSYQDLPAFKITNAMLALSEPYDTVLNSELKRNVELVLGCLSSREEAILRALFGIDEDGIDNDERSYEEIGKEFGVSADRVRHIADKAIRKLRHPTRSEYLKEFNY